MDHRRLFQFILLFFVFLELVFAGGRIYTETNGVEWSYEIWRTTDTSSVILDNAAIVDGSGGSFSSTGTATYTNNPGEYARLFRYPELTEDYTFKKAGVDLSQTGTTPNTNFQFIPYRSGGTNELSTTCQPFSQSLSNPIGNVYRLSSTSSLQQVQTSTSVISNLNNIDHLLEKYYYMKNLAFIRLYNEDTGLVEEFYAFDGGLGNYNFDLDSPGSTKNQIQGITGANALIYDGAASDLADGSNEYPYILLDWTTKNFDRDLSTEIANLKSQCDSNDNFCGKYSVQAFVVPIDGKCNVNNDGGFLVSGTDFIADSTNSLELDICPGTQTYDSVLGCIDPGTNSKNLRETTPLSSWNWRIYDTDDSSGTQIKSLLNNDAGIPSNNIERIDYDDIQNQRWFIFPTNGEEHALINTHPDFDYTAFPTTNNFQFTPYRMNGVSNPELDNQWCKVDNRTFTHEGASNFKLVVDTTLNPLRTTGGQEITNLEPIDDLLRQYYYTKAFAFVRVDNEDVGAPGGFPHYYDFEDVEGYYSYTDDLTQSSFDIVSAITSPNPLDYGPAADALDDGSENLPFVLLNWSTTELNIDLFDEFQFYKDQCDLGDENYCGNYSVTAFVVPIDGKCDLPNGPTSEFREFQPRHTPSLLQKICPLGETYNFATNQCEVPVNLTGVIEEVDYEELNYANCFTGPNGGLIFNGALENGDPTTISMNGPLGFTKAQPDTTSGQFFAFTIPKFQVREGTYDLNFGGEVIASCDVDEYWDYDQDETILYEDNLSESGLGDEARYRLEENTTVDFFEVDENNTVYFRENVSGVSFVPAPGIVPINTTKFITTYFEGKLVSQEQADETKLALHLHKIKNLNNVTDAVDELNDISSITSSYDIIINLSLNNYTSCHEGAFWTQEFNGTVPTSDGSFCFTNDSYKERTSVKIKLNGTAGTDIVVYQVIPKSVASSYDQIKFINDGGAQRFVSDKDPIIGWYFNETDGDEEIEFEVPGNSSGGETIIGQEAILYNEGELVVNYRTGSCNPDEANIFDLEDLVDSRVFAPGTSTYKVCVAHLTETLYNDNTGINSHQIMKYNDSGNASYNMLSGFVEDVIISVNDSSIFWGMKVQYTNPEGNYSCIGSINNEDNSLFGDCGYSNSKIWLHLGDDITPPVSELSYPIVSHSIPVTINATDEGSGLKTIYYCVDIDDTCDPLNGTGVSGGSSISFTVGCSDSWGCLKFVRFQSEDNEGNIEEIQSRGLKMLDQGSSCQADCTVRPSPNRYVAECNNLNSCNYYDYDDTGTYDNGAHVAGICDLLIEGSHARFNSTHDIQCPAGPFRLTRFVDELLDVDASDETCPVLYTEVFPVLVEGESVLMKIISCII